MAQVIVVEKRAYKEGKLGKYQVQATYTRIISDRRIAEFLHTATDKTR